MMTISKENTVIGFVGTGVMGKSMAGHLLRAGYQVLAYNRTKARAEELIQMGAREKTLRGNCKWYLIILNT